MFKRLAHLISANDAVESAARQPFLRPVISLGRCVDLAKTSLPLLIEEASWYAEQQLKWTGLAIAGELAAEGLWTYQIKKQREEKMPERAV